MKKLQVNSGPGASQSSLTYIRELVIVIGLLNPIMKLIVLTQNTTTQESNLPCLSLKLRLTSSATSQPINTIVQLKPAYAPLLVEGRSPHCATTVTVGVG